MEITLWLVCVVCIVPGVFGYKSRAAPKACLTMMPGHGQAAQTSQTPYSVSVDKTAVKAGDTVKVTVSATDSSNFQGFLVQARCKGCSTADSAIIGGAFTKMASTDGDVQAVMCPNAATVMNSMTHTDNNVKTSVSMNWKVPSGVSGQIEFRATVLREFNTFWMNHRSQTIQVTGSDTNSNTNSNTNSPSSSTTSTLSVLAVLGMILMHL